MPESDEVLCVCGHPGAAHRHLRAGSECSLCEDCPRFRSAGSVWQRLLRRLGGR